MIDHDSMRLAKSRLGQARNNAASRDMHKRVQLIAAYSAKPLEEVADLVGLKPVTVMQHCVEQGLALQDFDGKHPADVRRWQDAAKKKARNV